MWWLALAVADPWLGINEALDVPEGVPGEVREARLRHTIALGVDGVRLQGGRGLDRLERDLGSVREAGLSAIVVVAPWPPNRPWDVVSSCGVMDPAGWTATVQGLVERHGDVVVAWEVDNEPDLHDSQRPGFCPPELHAETVRITAAAIRAVDPDATVLSGGLYRPESVWARSLRTVADAAAVHLYVPSAGGEWITEASLSGARPVDQARGLAQLWARHRSARALVWHTLADPPRPRRGGVPSPGLLEVVSHDGGAVPVTTAWRERPAADVLRRLVTASGPTQSEGGLVWVRTEGGWLVWSAQRRGVGTPPADLAAIAGRARKRRDGRWVLRGVASAPDGKVESDHRGGPGAQGE